MKLDLDKLDFEHCEQEQIHIPESVQGYGYLFAIDRNSLKIEIISANTSYIFDQLNLVGRPFMELMCEGSQEKLFLQETFERVQHTETRLPIRVKFESHLVAPQADTEYFAVAYSSGPYYVVELEPSSQFKERYNADQFVKLYAMTIAPRFESLTSLNEMAQQMVDTIRYLTNMQRVVLYKFNDDHSGKVIAEAKCDDMDSYRDLYFPASDIPPQARELYKVNWVRLVPDIDLPASPLLPTIGDTQREPLDMTQSLLRTFSPIHLQYVRNQGLKSSFSVSLVTGNRLYGLISCHSREPNYISQDVRLQCENLSQLFSWHLVAKEEQLLAIKRNDTDKAVDNMLGKIGPANSIIKVIKHAENEFLEAMNCDGFIYYAEQETINLGHTLDIGLVKMLVSRASAENHFPYIIENLYHEFPAEKLNGIAGVMIIPLFEKKKYFTAWFRKESIQHQRWTGVEKETSVNASKKERLQPRASFAVNTQEISGCCEPFDQSDITAANRLNRIFLMYALDAQERMQTSLNNLKKQEQHRNEFLATLAHELRNPLTPINTGVQILETDPDGPTKTQVVSIIKRQAEHMSKLIGDLMDVSRITRGKIKIDFEPLDLQEVIQHSLEIVDELIQHKSHKVTVSAPPKTLFVKGDPARLSQIFSNILHNAAKYTQASGNIEIKLSAEKNMATISICDNGLGIPPQRLEDIFEMFTQVDAHATNAEGGLGIGLTLVKKLVELHKGKISVASQGIGSGTQFDVVLPLTKADEHQQSSNASQTAAPTQHNKILFVDDNQDILETYTLLCNSLGYEAIGISDPFAAEKTVQSFKPDFVFLDIGMPGMSGYELCRKLKQLSEAANTRFYALSGWGSPKDIALAKQAGFKQHFVKPVSLATLQSALQKNND